MRNRNIQKIAQEFCNYMENSGFHDFRAFTECQLPLDSICIYAKRILHNNEHTNSDINKTKYLNKSKA